MSLDEFNEELEKFKLDLINSEIYKEYIKADRAIYEDKKAIELSLKKDELEKELNYLYTGEDSKILIDEKMKKINEIQKELYSLESVKRYIELRMKLKEVLSVLEQGIPVIKQDNLENKVVAAKGVDNERGAKKVFPDIPLEKKEDIFPSFPEINKSNSFFDENEFKDLSNYMEDSEKKSWF